jgi:hypothetical protein
LSMAFCFLTAKIRLVQAITNRFGLQNKSLFFSCWPGRQMLGLFLIFRSAAEYESILDIP